MSDRAGEREPYRLHIKEGVDKGGQHWTETQRSPEPGVGAFHMK